MTLLTVLIIFLIVGGAMWLISAKVPSPASWILLVVCGIALTVFVLQVCGLVNVLNVKVGG